MESNGAARIAIVGAGFGGLATALELKRAGIDDFVILERQAGVGGVERQHLPGRVLRRPLRDLCVLVCTEARLVATVRRPTGDPGLSGRGGARARPRAASPSRMRGDLGDVGRVGPPVVASDRGRRRGRGGDRGLRHRPAEQPADPGPAGARLRHNFTWWKFESNVPLIYRSSDPIRKVVEARLRRMIRRKVGRPLAAQITPSYPFGCNRVLLSSQWYPALARRNVSVYAAGVSAVTPTSVVTDDGHSVDADVIVWCTGFTPTEYIAPMEVIGRDGIRLRDEWADGPEAYLGITTPGFPNLFMSYGPNTGSLTNTIIFLLERQAIYIRQAVDHISRADAAIDVRPDVHERFNRQLQERLGQTVFTRGCPGWYTTESGKVTTVWPGSHVAYARATKEFVPSDFEAVPA